MDFKLLNHIKEVFDDIDLSKTLVIACQHLLGTQSEMFKRLFALGLNPQNCFILGKNYSTNMVVCDELKKQGCFIDEASFQYDPEISFDDWFSKELKRFISETLSKISFEDFNNVIVLDDGGLLTSEIISFDLPFEKFNGIEQTSSGWAKLADKKLPFNVFFVARTYAKLRLETPYISKLSYERIIEHIKERGFVKPKILIVGNQGYVGASLQKRFICAGYDVRGFDIKQGELLDQKNLNLSDFEIVIGTTGFQSISTEEVLLMSNHVSLISTSSSDREFSVLSYRDKGTILHQNHFFSGRCLVNSGFPITFYGNYHELPPKEIEITCSLLMLGVCYYSLPEEDERFQGQFLPIMMKRLSIMYLEGNSDLC